MSQMTDRKLIEACAKFMGYVVDEITEPDHDNPSTVTFVYDPKAPKNLRDNEQPIKRLSHGTHGKLLGRPVTPR